MTETILIPGPRSARDGKPYLTMNQAAVLCAVAAHWRVFGRAPVFNKVRKLANVQSDARNIVFSLTRRGFLTYDSGKGGRFVSSTVRPTPKGWDELCVPESERP